MSTSMAYGGHQALPHGLSVAEWMSLCQAAACAIQHCSLGPPPPPPIGKAPQHAADFEGLHLLAEAACAELTLCRLK